MFLKFVIAPLGCVCLGCFVFDCLGYVAIVLNLCGLFDCCVMLLLKMTHFDCVFNYFADCCFAVCALGLD